MVDLHPTSSFAPITIATRGHEKLCAQMDKMVDFPVGMFFCFGGGSKVTSGGVHRFFHESANI